ncbi:hypothetical protein NQ318_005079 [Aromia moschata]|uniref:Polyprotein n=1 Tax=Aromia moschata TaxID=1265417 RepID=A0AAV8YFP9_9CUCU|nr:hypothetical protein NQ318_005079 [Aromia moschata]
MSGQAQHFVTRGFAKANANAGAETKEANAASEGAQLPSTSLSASLLTKNVLLSTAVVYVKDAKGTLQPARALLDSGSQSSFVTEELINKLQLLTLLSVNAGKHSPIPAADSDGLISHPRLQQKLGSGEGRKFILSQNLSYNVASFAPPPRPRFLGAAKHLLSADESKTDGNDTQATRCAEARFALLRLLVHSANYRIRIRPRGSALRSITTSLWSLDFSSHNSRAPRFIPYIYGEDRRIVYVDADIPYAADFLVKFTVGGIHLLTALTAGGVNEVDIATPTRDAMLSLRMPNATAAPDSKAIKQPTHREQLINKTTKDWLPTLNPHRMRDRDRWEEPYRTVPTLTNLAVNMDALGGLTDYEMTF